MWQKRPTWRQKAALEANLAVQGGFGGQLGRIWPLAMGGGARSGGAAGGRGGLKLAKKLAKTGLESLEHAWHPCKQGAADPIALPRCIRHRA